MNPPAVDGGWKVCRLKDVAQLVTDVLPEDTDPAYEFDYVDIGNVSSEGKVVGADRILFGTAPSRARRRVQNSDIIISTVRTYLKAVALIDQPHSLIVSTGFAVLRPKPEVHPAFLWRSLQSEDFLHRVVSHSEGVGYPAIPSSRLMALPISVPQSREDQVRIVDHLQRRGEEVDLLITKKQSLIRASQERFDALADHLIQPLTRAVEPLKYVSGGVTVGVVVNPSSYVDATGSVPFFRGVDVQRYSLNLEASQRISTESNRALSKSRLSAGDVVTVRDGAPGLSAVVPEEAHGSNCASLLITRRSPRIDSRYLCHVFNSPFGRSQFRLLSYGAAQLHVNVSAAVRFQVPLPDIEEQCAIASRLDDEWKRLKEWEAIIRRQIATLAEYRQTVITNAVNGRIEARRLAQSA